MKRILVALDGSERAPHILQVAADLGKKTGAKLMLYRAVGIPAELPSLALSRSPQDIADLLQGLAKKGLEELTEKNAPADLVEGIRVSLAIPWQGICEMARAVAAELVVIGSHGYGGLDRVLGTTAARVVNHCPISVLVVKNA